MDLEVLFLRATTEGSSADLDLVSMVGFYF